MSDTDLIQQLINVEKGLSGNPNFPNTPVDLATFKSGIDTLTVLVTDAADGSKKAITAKNKQREDDQADHAPRALRRVGVER
jgi:hypothetical protein